MPSLYDHLNAELGGDEPGGITPLEITDLPADQRIIMLALLRDQAAQDSGVLDAALRAKVTARVSDFDAALAVLVHEGWLIVSGEAPQVFYRVNFRPKRGSNARVGLWTVLNDRISPTDTPG